MMNNTRIANKRKITITIEILKTHEIYKKLTMHHINSSKPLLSTHETKLNLINPVKAPSKINRKPFVVDDHKTQTPLQISPSQIIPRPISSKTPRVSSSPPIIRPISPKKPTVVPTVLNADLELQKVDVR
jgi:hypothetical protein